MLATRCLLFARGWLAALGLVCLLLPSPAHAYVGPGMGLTAIGAVIAFFAAVCFVVVGFFWYPIKRLRKNLKDKRRQATKPSMPEDADG